MNKTFKYIYGAAMAAALSLAACSPENFDSVSETDVPTVESATVTIDVDQTINQATFTMEGSQIYPVWMFTSGSSVTYSTTNGLQKIYSTAGDYTVNYRVGNRNGISLGTGEASFNIENTIVDYDVYEALLCDKTWKIASDEEGHLACGESGTDGTNWYSATANEKADYGLYDDEITFSTDGVYTYDPGAGGTVFVNTGCTVFDGYSDDEDYMVPVESQTSTYEIGSEGDDIYITLGSNTLFPYISCDDQYYNPKFRLESLTSSKMVLIYDNGEIAWHYILESSSGDDSSSFDGYDADSDCNLFKNCTYTNSYYYAPGWSQIDDPELTADGNYFTISLPTATSDQWQAQVFFNTDMTTSEGTYYDFSCKLMSTTDHSNVTVKLYLNGDDGTYYFVEQIALTAYEEYVFYQSNMEGIEMDAVNLVLDFGGNADNTTITLYDIDLQEHACDGIEAPEESEEEEDNTVYDYDAETNIWKSAVDDDNNFDTYLYYAPGWTQIDDPEFTGDHGTYTVVLPTATYQQWQAQVHIITDISIEGDTEYDFCCTILSTQDISDVTVKLTDTTSDDNYMFTERVDVEAYTETTVKLPAGTMSAADAVKLVFDFGGNPDNTTVTMYDIVLQKTTE